MSCTPVKSFIRLTRTTILNYSKTTRHILFIVYVYDSVQSHIDNVRLGSK